MDDEEFETTLLELSSRALDALEEYKYMVQKDTGDFSAVMENLEVIFLKLLILKQKNTFALSNKSI